MAPTTFRMRIVSMDYYMSPPIPQVDVCYNPFQGQVVAEVPVIRIYGSTLGGQKACLHIHQAFPYLYVPYDNDLPQNIEEGYAYVRYLASAIEKAIKLSSSIGAKRQHVHSCSLVRAKKFYGYHSSEQLFIKIVLYYPEEVSRVAALLLGGGILNHVFQPHESHIPYLLQFLIDHNLYGMGHIHSSKVRFRYPLPDGILDRSCLFRDVAFKQIDGGKGLDDVVALDSEKTCNGPEAEPVIPCTFEYAKSSRRDGIGTSAVEAGRETPEAVNNHSELWLRSEVPSGWILSQSIPDLVGGSPCEGKHPDKRQSTCELEGDTTVQEILNQHQLMYIPLSQAGSDVKMVQSLLQIWEEEYSRTGSHMTVEKFDDQKPPAERVLKILSHGQEYQNLISKLVAVNEQKINFLKSYPVTPSEKDKADQNIQEMKASPNGSSSGEGHMHDQLVKFTQAANSKELTPRLPVSSLVILQDAADATSKPSVGEQGLNIPDVLVDEDIVRSQKTRSTDLKDVDKEAIELLRWLASSQADSENKEDEEFVLSQLLCSDSIERVLEKAHSNYENASQKECKDILSSMEDLEDYIKGKSNHLGHPSQESIPQHVGYASLHDDVIPQLDGMWDDLVNNPRPTMLKEEKPKKKLKPLGNGSDNICRGVVTPSSSADEPLRNKALWGSLPLARNGGDRNDSPTGDSMSDSEDNPKEDKFSVNLGNVDELKELSLRDQMRKKRTRRPDILESEHLIAPKKMTLDKGTEHGIRCQYRMTILENAYQKAESISDDMYGDTSEKCHASKVSKDRAIIRPLELKECSEKHGNKMVDEKVSRFRPLPLVKQRTVDHNAEAYGQQHSEHVRRNIFNEETEVYSKSVTVGPEKDHEGKKWVQAEADHCGIQTEVPKNIYQEESDKKLEYVGSDHQHLAEEEYSIVMEPFALKKLVANERICGDITPCKELEGKAEAGPELQTCLMHASDGEDPRNQKRIGLRTHLTDIASESKCSSQCNSHSSGWESDHGWKQQIRPSENQARECQSDDLLDAIGIKEHLVEKRDLLGMNNSSVECQAGPREETPVNRHEKYLRVSGEKLQLSKKDDSYSIRPADTELHSLNLRDCVEDKLIPLAFHLKPPTKDQIKAGSGNGSLTSVEHGGVYYGNVEDVPDVPVVIAGSVFEVKSREVKYLRPCFLEKGQWGYWNERECMDKKMRDPCHGFETVTGIPMHYQNNGSALCLVTPAQPPPSSSAIIKWLSQVKGESLGDASEQKGIGSCSNSQVDDKQPHTVQNVEGTKMHVTSKQSTGISSCFDSFDVASPKYDENRVSIIGSASSSQCEGAFCQLHQPASSGTNGFRSFNSLDKICSTIQSFNDRQFADGSPSSPEVGAYHILKEPKHENIPVSNPSKLLQNEKLQKETIHDKSPKIWRDVSQISAPSPTSSKQTPGSQTGFRDPASVGAGQQLTLMSIEIHAQSRGELTPDPRYDAINIIVVVIQEDFNQTKEVFVLMRDEKANACNRNIDGVLGCEVFAVNDEKTLFYLFIQLVRLYDPDILMGWEIQGGSLGFLAERAAYVGIGLLKKISRTPFFETKLGAVHSEDVRRSESKESVPEELPAAALELHDTIIEDEWGRTHGSGIHVGGRIVLNLWRIMRGELNLGIYTLEAVAEAVLRRKIPNIPWCTLTWWFLSGPSRGRFRCIEYIVDRAQLNLAIMDQMDMINRTSELARVFGIDFFSVLSRGSQYRVESMMLRLAHTQNFLVISPSKHQVASQPAMECLPLVMEPESRFYTDPVVVLDFQSLYPSMIIAYNLCFSTCLGKVMAGKNKILGVTSYTPDICLSEMEDCLFITPNGVMFVPPEVCRGVLPRLLQEILSTRIMVKNAMKKLLPTQRVLQRVLNARQLALKLIANVTYGYTAAGFSGRMPCAEIADSIVQCGRRTLENAINFVNSNSEWNARVVYGDTDSMFVLLKGRTREEAFRIGQEIASAITATNPQPVTLKMEKVYHPCVLLTKKRYVGYSYESCTQSKPIFDAKGIETVRRDSCPAVAKILERSLRILFESHDLSQVKSYLYRQWRKIISGRVSLQDFIFAKEVRLGTYSMKASSLPPAAIVATKSMRVDPRTEPHYGERVRYVVIHGEPGARLADMVVDPLELLDINTPHRLHDTYYITKQIIPALQRVFGLVGVDLKSWYSEMPRPVRPMIAKRCPNVSPSRSRHSVEGYDGKKYQKGPPNRSTIDHYYLSQHCVVCGELIRGSRFLCDHCSVNRCTSALTMIGRTSRLEKEIEHLDAICRHCGGGDVGEKGIKCTSLDCPVFYERRKVQKELLVVSQVSTESGFYPPCMVELF